MNERTRMDEAARRALADVLNHFWPAEHADYMATAPEDRKGHIFQAIMFLDAWLTADRLKGDL